jgi:hypothetical protein
MVWRPLVSALLFVLVLGVLLCYALVVLAWVRQLIEFARAARRLNTLLSASDLGFFVIVACVPSLLAAALYGWSAGTPFFAGTLGASSALMLSRRVRAPAPWSDPRSRASWVNGFYLALTLASVSSLVGLADGGGGWFAVGMSSGPLLYAGVLNIALAAIADALPSRELEAHADRVRMAHLRARAREGLCTRNELSELDRLDSMTSLREGMREAVRFYLDPLHWPASATRRLRRGRRHHGDPVG